MKRYLVAAVVTAFVAIQALGAEYYVATTGSDSNPGTAEEPWATVKYAVSQMAAGDTVWVHGGLYSGQTRISPSAIGTEAAPFRIWAVPGELPVLDFTGDSASNAGMQISGAWWHIKGLQIQHAGSGGIRIKSASTVQHNTIENCIAYANGNMGISIAGTDVAGTIGPSYNTVINCDAYENFDSATKGENADGFAAKFYVSVGNRFIGCRSWSNSDDGYDMWHAGSGVYLEDCWGWDNGVDIWGVGSTFAGDGNCFKLGQLDGAHTLVRCVAWDHPHNGFDLNGNTNGGITITNCTAFNNDRNFSMTNGTNMVTDILRNNISFQPVSGDSISTQVTQEYNSWQTPPGVSLTTADFASLDTSALEGWREADWGLPLVWTLRLAQTSNAIDAGMDAGVPYAGTAPDLGAFEAGDTTGDNIVDWFDVEKTAEDWLKAGVLTDIDLSGSVNFVDYAIMLQYWTQG